MPTLDLIDLPKEVQKSNMGSIKQNFWYAPLSYFATDGVKVPAATTIGTMGTISDTHAFITGKGFHSAYNTLDKGGVDFDPQGERDGRSYKQKGEAFIPGSRLELHDTLGIMLNEPCIVLMEESDGQIIQIGSKDYFAEMIGKFSTGKTTAGLRGYALTIESVSPFNYHYTGDSVLFGV